MGAIITGMESFSGLAPERPPTSVFMFTFESTSGSVMAPILMSFLKAMSERCGIGRAAP